MTDMMTFPDTVEEFMEQYKITDTERIYTNGAELVPIFRMRQWFDHKPETHWIPCSERLPEEGQKCLVYDKTIGFRVDTYIGHGNPYNWELFVRDYEAWMPIPKLTGGDVE